ncbi:MAG: PDZ domain-containing protein [Spirochaetes bacterium]|nr:PDZ domain-containing protein [Spirochaetota bacterium]
MKKILILFICILLSSCFAGKDQFGGLGIEVPSGIETVTDENPYKIVNVYEGFPGAQVGLQPGDIIISIDGNVLKGLTQEHIYKNLLRGKAGTTVILEIKREDKTLIFRPVRQKIIVQE